MKYSLILMLGMVSLQSLAQQEAMFTHYFMNSLAINPAYAGSRDAMTLTALNRSQWSGFTGAPKTQNITLHSPFKREDMAFGASVMLDRIGPVSNSSFYADYAYKVPLLKGTLSMGLKGGLDLQQINLTQLYATDLYDNSLAYNVRNRSMLNFGIGAYYSQQKFYVGLSTPKILEYNLNEINNPTARANSQRHYYLMGGGLLDINQSIAFKPMGLIKVTQGAPIQADLTTLFVFNKHFELGAMYRTTDAAGFIFGVNLDNNLRVGYSFDWSFGFNTGPYNAGSHELVLRYDFIKTVNKKIVSPRYF
jgi:type IX secretion system PorP/SprF family membrane protein